MRIIYVNDALAIWGGLERIIVEKINYLADEYGYEIHLLTVNQGLHIIPYSISPQVIYHDLDIRFHQQYVYSGIRRLIKRWQLNRLFVKRLRDYIFTTKPDVIVSVRAELTAGIVRAKGNIPLVFESHTSRYSQKFIDADWYTRLITALNNRSVRYAKIVVALTEGDALDWRDINSNVIVIPNVVHLNSIGFYSKCEKKSAIFVGRFSRQKDIRSLLAIWEIVHNRHPDWSLHIYGGYGEEQVELLPLIARMRANIQVHEPTPDIFEKYLECSVSLLTSRFEPFGLVLPEAMSSGLPVVAFDCPYGPAEIITDGKDGFVIKNRDIQAFAAKLCDLIENKELRFNMGRAGIVSSRRYSADRIMPLWHSLFTQLIE